MRFNTLLIFRIASSILIFAGIAMVVPFGFACWFSEYSAATSFFIMSLVCILFGAAIRRLFPASDQVIQSKEGYITVLLSWFLVILVGATPYYWADMGYSFIDCFFESCAGWTTTGATVMDYAHMPKSLILWKVVSSWFGGMGIIVLTTSIFPRLGIGGQRMAATEIPGPQLEKLTARFGDTAKIIYSIYLLLTVVEFLLLLPSDMDVYLALVNTLSTVSTAGIIDLSSAQEHFVITPYIKTVLAVFSITSSVSFMSYFLVAIGRFRDAFRNAEVQTFFRVILGAGVLMSFFLYADGVYDTYLSALGNGIVQSISFCTTTGFIIDDLSGWPVFCQLVLFILALVGGCSFSTSGGMKIIRFKVMLRLIQRGLFKRIHPRSIKPIMIQKKPVSAQSASSIAAFLMLYFGIFMVSAIIISLDNYDLETTFSAAMACLTNNGTGFGRMTGSDFSIFSLPVRLYLIVLMLCGRLEIYGILILLSPSYWNSDRTKT